MSADRFQRLKTIYLQKPEDLPLCGEGPTPNEFFKFHCLYDTDPALIKAILKHSQISGSVLNLKDQITDVAYETLKSYKQFQHLYVFEDHVNLAKLKILSKSSGYIKPRVYEFLSSENIPGVVINKYLQEACETNNIAVLCLLVFYHIKKVKRYQHTIDHWLTHGNIIVKKFLSQIK